MRLYTPLGDPVDIPDDALRRGTGETSDAVGDAERLRAYRRQEKFDEIVTEHGIRGVHLEDLPADMEISAEAVRAAANTRDAQAAGMFGLGLEDYRDLHARLANGERPEPPALPAWMTETPEERADRAYREARERRQAPDAARAAYIMERMRG